MSAEDNTQDKVQLTEEQLAELQDFMDSQAQPSGYSNGDMLNLIDNISKRVLYSLTNSKVEKNEAFIKLRNEIKEIMEQEAGNYKE